eukprot:8342786-Karenia_brevis.AAC.1
MIQGVEDQGPWVDKPQVQVDSSVKVDACTVEVDSRKSWHVGAVERVPYAARSTTNIFEKFWSPDEDAEMSDDENEEYVLEIPSLESSSDESDAKVEKSRDPSIK